MLALWAGKSSLMCRMLPNVQNVAYAKAMSCRRHFARTGLALDKVRLFWNSFR